MVYAVSSLLKFKEGKMTDSIDVSIVMKGLPKVVYFSMFSVTVN